MGLDDDGGDGGEQTCLRCGSSASEEHRRGCAENVDDQDYADEGGNLFVPGDESPLADSLDSYLTRTPAHRFDGDE